MELAANIIGLNKNFAGVYIIFNKTKNMYYVGQSVKVIDRVYAHFSGYKDANQSIFYDYMRGDFFSIKIIPLKESGYKSLNRLERHGILAHDSFYSGYNKTRGNKT